MKIELQHPYNKDWKFGYIVTNPENRKTVVLYNGDNNRTSTAYARYLFSISIGRYLLDCEHIDHIDNDKTNDVLENLQILTKEENNKKEGVVRGLVYVELKCPICGNLFSKRTGHT